MELLNQNRNNMLTETQMDINQVLRKLIDWGIDAGKDILAAVLIYIVGRFIIKYVTKLVTGLMRKRNVEASVQTFLRSFLGIILNLILVFAIISKLGVETTSFAALLASAGVAIGMALSGNLSNFAGGLIVLMFKPFKVGDYIEGAGVSGTVQEIQIFHTILLTPDNRVIFAPNGALSSNAVTNYSKKELRRVDFSFGVEYNEEFDKVKHAIQRIIDADLRILKEPSPTIELGALSASSVDITVRVWVKTADYWDVFFNMNKTVYAEFNKEGIKFPFPQLTVHKADK